MQIVNTDLYVKVIENQIEFQNEAFAMLVSRQLFQSNSYKNLTIFFRILDDDFSSDPIVFYIQSQSFVAEILDQFILEMHQHGFTAYLHSKYLEKLLPEDDDEGPQVLTLQKLSAGFFVWIGSVAVACIVFIGEFVSFYSRRFTLAIVGFVTKKGSHF